MSCGHNCGCERVIIYTEGRWNIIIVVGTGRKKGDCINRRTDRTQVWTEHEDRMHDTCHQQQHSPLKYFVFLIPCLQMHILSICEKFRIPNNMANSQTTSYNLNNIFQHLTLHNNLLLPNPSSGSNTTLLALQILAHNRPHRVPVVVSFPCPVSIRVQSVSPNVVSGN